MKDAELKKQCQAHGLTDPAQHEQVRALAGNGMALAKILALVAKYGPGILTDLLGAFAGGGATATP